MPEPTYNTAGDIQFQLGKAWWVLEVAFTSGAYKSYNYFLTTQSGVSNDKVSSIVTEVWVDSPYNGWVRVKVLSVRPASLDDRHKLASLFRPGTAPIAEAPKYIPFDFKTMETAVAAKDSLVMQELSKYNLTQKEPATVEIKITTPTLLNGLDIKTYADSQLFSLIATKEKEREALDKIAARPKALAERIATIDAEIQALVLAMDAR